MDWLFFVIVFSSMTSIRAKLRWKSKPIPCSFFSPSFSIFQLLSFLVLHIVSQKPIVYLFCHPSDITLQREKVPLWHIITWANKSPLYWENSFVPWWRRLLTAKKGNTSPHVHLKRNFMYFVFPFYLTALQSGS